MVKAQGQGSHNNLLWRFWSFVTLNAFNLKQLRNKHGWPAKKIFGGPQAMTVGAAQPPKCNCSLEGPGLVEPAWARIHFLRDRCYNWSKQILHSQDWCYQTIVPGYHTWTAPHPAGKHIAMYLDWAPPTCSPLQALQGGPSWSNPAPYALKKSWHPYVWQPRVPTLDWKKWSLWSVAGCSRWMFFTLLITGGHHVNIRYPKNPLWTKHEGNQLSLATQNQALSIQVSIIDGHPIAILRPRGIR